MATKKTIINKDTVKALTTKDYYSWLDEGKGSTAYVISDSLSSLLFDVGTDVLGQEVPDLITIEHGTQNASVRTIASGIAYAGQDSFDVYAPKAVAINSVKATSIYGGAIITTKAGNKSTWYYSNTINAKRTDTEVTVKGDVNLSLASVKATSVYGGGAGYGSTLDGDVNITVKGTSTISNLFGGGQKGAAVYGDVNITIDRTGNNSGGRISNVYGGGENADVFGNAYITVRGTNAVGISTISGQGKGTTGMVHGSTTLEIADYSGQFTASIKNFDLIRFTGDTAATLTKGQDKTVKSATYEFLIDSSAFGQSSEAMLVWNQKVDTGHFVVTIDTDDDFVANGFEGKKIYYSKYLTANAAANISVQTLAGEDIDDSMYTLEFVADTDNKGDAKKQGGYVVLNYAGSNYSVTPDTLEDVLLTSASDRVNIKGDVVDVFVDTGSGNDRVAVQSGTEMRGDIYLGKGTNVLNVQQNALVTGSVVVSADSKNTINLNGAINQIEGGDATTQNIVNINNANALGGYDLTFENDTADTVVVSTASNYSGNINFGKGKDTLVLNTNFTAGSTITSDDGNDIIVANKSGVTIDATNFRLTGTDNALVIANGVVADVEGFAFGDFANLKSDTFSKGLYLGQNAILGNGDAGNDIAVSSFNGDFHLKGNMTILAKDQLDATADAELIARIGDYYTAGTGVNGDILADGNTVFLSEGAEVNGTITNADNVWFLGTAGGAMEFAGAAVRVAEGATATVKSIKGLDVSEDTVLGNKDYFETDLGLITLGNDAQVIATNESLVIDGKVVEAPLTIAGNIKKDVSFAGTAEEKKNVVIKDGILSTAKVTLDNTNTYFAGTAMAGVEGAELALAGKNAIAVKSTDLTLDNKKLDVSKSEEIKVAILDNGKLTINGIANGEESKIKAADVTISTNAEFVVGDTTETGDWNRQFVADDATTENVLFRDGAQVIKGINITAATARRNIVIGDNAYVKNDAAAAAITLGAGRDALTIGDADIYGRIDATVTGGGRDADGFNDIITLKAGATVSGIYAATDVNTLTTAIDLRRHDKLVATEAQINGNVAGGKVVELTKTTVTGDLQADGTIATAGSDDGAFLKDSAVGTLAGEATVLKGEAEVSATIGSFQAGRLDVIDGAVAQIGSIADNEDNTRNTTVLNLVNGGTVTGEKILAESTTSSRINVINAEAQAIEQKSNAATVAFNFTDTEGATVFATTAKTGDITQSNKPEEFATVEEWRAAHKSLGNTENTVDADVDITQQYVAGTYAGDKISAVNDPIVAAALSSETGAVKQEGAVNAFSGVASLTADGAYATATAGSLANEELHKAAQVTVDKISATYGDVKQTGRTNDFDAGLTISANGESDVWVKEVSNLTVGAIKQTSFRETGLTGNVNDVSIVLDVASGDAEDLLGQRLWGQQSKLVLDGDVMGTVDSITQTAYDNDNYVELLTQRYDESALKDDPDNGDTTATDEAKAMKAYGVITQSEGKTAAAVAMEVAHNIEMYAYKGNNQLDLNSTGDAYVNGTINVKGNIVLGGSIVVDATTGKAKLLDATAGDRVAEQNTLRADAGTVTVDGTISMVGLTNTLRITNSTGAAVEFAKDRIFLAGNNNVISVDANVTTGKIHTYKLVDNDGYGLEEYEIGTGVYTNSVLIKGEAEEYVSEVVMANDKVNVVGGTVKGDVITKNSDPSVAPVSPETIRGDVVRVGDGAVEAKSVIGKNVTMGVADDPSGQNTLLMRGTGVNAGTIDEVVYKAEIGGNVAQYADNHDNLLSMTDYAEIKGTVTQVGNARNKVKLGTTANEIVGKTTQNATAVTSEITVNGEKHSVYGDEAMNQFGIESSSNKSTTKVGDVEQTSVSTRGSENEWSLANEVYFVGKMDEVNPDKTIYGELDKKASYTFYASAGAISQNGSANKVEVKQLEAVKSISQTATALEYADKTTFAKFVKTNNIVSKGNATVGTVDQTLTNVAYTKYTKEAEATEFIGTGTEAYTKANNELEASGLVTDTFKKDKGAPFTKDQFHNGEYVSTIGNVTQTLTGVGDAEGSQAKNSIVLDDIKAGALTQTATGNAKNSIYYTGTTDLIAQYRYGDVTKTEDPTLAYAADAITSRIESITQVSNAALFKSGDVKTTYTSGSNSVTLKNVEVGAISATSGAVVYNTEKVLEGDKLVDKKTLDVVASSEVTLEDVKATAGITTGAGNDVITLKGKTSVIGTIDGGTFTKDASIKDAEIGTTYLGRTADSDTLNIMSADVDLSAATIIHVEKIAAAEKVGKIVAKSIQAEDITFTDANSTLAAKTLDISGTVTKANHINADTLTLGTVNVDAVGVTVVIGAFDETSTAVNFTFNDDLKHASVYGAKTSTSDTLKIGADVDNLEVEIKDFETVTIENGASVTGVKWIDDNTTNKTETTVQLAFNINGLNSKTTTTGDDTFAIGTFIDYSAKELSFNGYTTDATNLGDAVWTKAGDTKGYTYAAGTLTYGTIA